MTIGSNSGFAAKELTAFAARVERLEEEKSVLAEDIKEVYSEAKSRGFDPAILKKAIRLRAMPKAEREQMQGLVDLYIAALEGADVAEVQKSYEAGA